MFCKVCKDAGKTNSEYTSHWIRNAPGPNGKVVCPTLLKQECKYCKKKGHTPKHCTKLQGKYKMQKHNMQTQAPQQTQFQQRARELCSSPPPREQAPQQMQAPQQKQFQQRARELCSSPPPREQAPQQMQMQAPHKGTVIPFDPTPIGKNTNYFKLLMVDDVKDAETKDAETNAKDAEIKDAETKSYKKDLDTNFPALGGNASFVRTTIQRSTQSYSAAAAASAQYEREDSPTPSPVSSRPHSPPPAPKKMPRVKEEEYCSPSPSPSPTTTTTITTRWADME